MPQLTVYKASAGSGKTFRLTAEYIKLLLTNPESYRHILAVTFTNKATAEMKERILKALSDLSSQDVELEPKGVAEVVGDELGMTPQQTKQKATLALSFLLHDYGRFRIETIDSFFQSILRNLARELGLGAWLNIELNNSGVLSDAVDALMDKADKRPELLQWMTEYIEEMLLEGKSWKIENELKEFGRNIFQESFKEKELVLKEKLSDKDFLKNYKKLLRAIEKEGLEKLSKSAHTFFDIITRNGLEVNDFSNKEKGACGYFLKLKKGQGDESIFKKAYVQNAFQDPSKWSTKSSKQNAKITALAESELNPLLAKTEALRRNLWKEIATARLAAKHLNQVGLLSDIASEVQELNLENHRFLLSNTNALLKSLLQGSDASFIYEKTGVELHHILFDEFQDTSRMQWDTFKPLLQEGLANGNDSLIVGDEKQSIYRWRNGDWRILGNISNETKPAVVVEKSLASNWRSAYEIVTFNNRLFSTLENQLNGFHQERFNQKSIELEKAYSDVNQIPERNKEQGLVDVTFLSTNDDKMYRQQVLSNLITKVEELQRNRVKPHDIAILIRYNKQIPEIGNCFAEYKTSPQADPAVCYDIVSDEAFLLRSSKSIQLILDALRLLNDPVDSISQALLKFDYQSDVLLTKEAFHPLFKQNPKVRTDDASEKTAYKKTFVDNADGQSQLPIEFINRFEVLQRLPLFELVEELYRIFELEKITAQDSYLHCFMDKLGEYLLHAPADIATFLNYWEENMADASIPAGSAVQGIRILSIHKSKGLEFHTVLVPFCDWKLLDARKLRVWCMPEKAPYNQLDLLPIDYGDDMKESDFATEYAEETLQLWVDALNLLYVTFTRARLNLYAWARGNDTSKKDKGPSTIGNLMQDTLQTETFKLLESKFIPAENIDFNPLVSWTSDSEDDSDESDESTTSDLQASKFIYGTFNAGIENDSKEVHSKDIPLPFKSFKHKTKFRQSNRSREFCKGNTSDSATSSYIDRGNLLHKLFQGIHKKEDLSSALQSLIHEGLLTNNEASVYETYTRNALNQKEASDWYSGNYRLYNECSILSPGKDGKLQLKRPDRVMINNQEVLVVDFKFGKPTSTHQDQVKDYMNLLTGMGHKEVKGYLWYVDENRVQQIKLDVRPH